MKARRFSGLMSRKVATLHAGGKSISEIISSGECGTLTLDELNGWLEDYPDFAKQMEEARKKYVDVLADEIVTLANEAANSDDDKAVQKAKLKIDARKTAIAMYAPERVGKGGRGMASSTKSSAKLSDNELVRRIMFGIDRARRGVPRLKGALPMPAMETADSEG